MWLQSTAAATLLVVLSIHVDDILLGVGSDVVMSVRGTADGHNNYRYDGPGDSQPGSWNRD